MKHKLLILKHSLTDGGNDLIKEILVEEVEKPDTNWINTKKKGYSGFLQIKDIQTPPRGGGNFMNDAECAEKYGKNIKKNSAVPRSDMQTPLPPQKGSPQKSGYEGCGVF